MKKNNFLPLGQASITIDRLPVAGEKVRLPFAELVGHKNGVFFHALKGTFFLTHEAISRRDQGGFILISDHDTA